MKKTLLLPLLAAVTALPGMADYMMPAAPAAEASSAALPDGSVMLTMQRPAQKSHVEVAWASYARIFDQIAYDIFSPIDGMACTGDTMSGMDVTYSYDVSEHHAFNVRVGMLYGRQDWSGTQSIWGPSLPVNAAVHSYNLTIMPGYCLNLPVCRYFDFFLGVNGGLVLQTVRERWSSDTTGKQARTNGYGLGADGELGLRIHLSEQWDVMGSATLGVNVIHNHNRTYNGHETFGDPVQGYVGYRIGATYTF